MEFITGNYINMFGKGKDILLLIGEANGTPTLEQYIKAEEIMEKFDYNQHDWKLELEAKLEEVFKFGCTVYTLK